MNIVQQFKVGWKTTEFWIAVFTAGVPFITFISGKKIDQTAVITFISMAVPAASYIFGRSWLKSNRVKAVAVVATAADPATAADVQRADTEPVLLDGVDDGAGQEQVAVPVPAGGGS